MKEKISNHLDQLLSLDTAPSNPDENIKALEIVKQVIGGQIIDNKQESSPLLVHSPNQPHLLWIGHVDIVSKHKNQKVLSKQDQIFNRGAFDMKGSVASFMSVLEENPSLKNKVGFILTTDEETGGFNGAKWLFESKKLNHSHIKGVVVGEPTNLKIGINSKSLLVLGINISGKSAHASQPWLGISASEAIINIAQIIQHDIFNNQPKSEKDWQTSFNFGLLTSGSEHTNIIPDHAELRIDIRFIASDSPSKFKSKINQLLKKLQKEEAITNFSLQTRAQNNSEIADPNNQTVKKLQKSVELILGQSRLINCFGSTDARHLSTISPEIPIIRFGPIGNGAHSQEEWVSQKSLNQQAEILMDFFTNL